MDVAGSYRYYKMARKAHIVVRVFLWLSVLSLVIMVLVIAGIDQSAIYPNVGDHLESLRKKVEQLRLGNAKLREEPIYLFDEAKYLLRESTKSTSTERNKHSAEGKPKHETPVLPTVKHERHVRKVGIDVRELGYYVTSRLEMSVANLTRVPGDINRMTNGTIEGLQQTLRQIKAYIRTTLVDLKAVSDPECDWRQKESEYLGKFVREKIHQIMNPKNCEKKKKFICDVRYVCGFGCEFHHVLYCMVTAIYHRRPMILLTSGWPYSGSGWETVFRPISDSCLGVAYDKTKKWRGNETDHDAVIPDETAPKRPRYLPLAIPEELAPRLTRLHGNPGVWWVGQLATYLWNFQPQTSRYVDEVASRIGFKSPIVGIHVRRTDKLIWEASAHFIHEYMAWVDEYYNQREMTEKIDKRRVFIATDDATVVLKARRLYPHYDILNDMDITMAAGTKKRFSPTSLLGIIADIDLLARSDFLVCTFSSNVCRLAYELLQAKHGDASQYFHSLDKIYHFHGQSAHHMTAIEPHVPERPEEMALCPGDKILIAGNHWDGYSEGKHSDKGQAGLFLSYKVEDAVEVVPYPYRFLPPDDGDNGTVANPA